jgi:hypothetical protein
MKTLFQAQLFAPALLFQTMMEGWSSLLEPAPVAAPGPGSQPVSRIEPLQVLPGFVAQEAMALSAVEPVDVRAMQLA